MIHVDFNPNNLPPDKKKQWDIWEEKARAATEAIIEDWEKWINDPETKDKKFPSKNFEEEIWRELRDFLLKDVFYNKCAYCETSIVGFKAHAEHFRPKAQVRFKVVAENKEVYRTGRTKDVTGAEIDHPGYFWLAYNWKNLLPSCQKCNTLEGKKDQFPIADGRSYIAVKKLTDEEIKKLKNRFIQRKTAPDIGYLEPDVLDELEDPQLLHPYFGEDPRDHLIFAADGKALPRDESKKGEQSIKVFDLNDGDLVVARQTWQKNAFREYATLLLIDPAQAREKSKEALAKYIEGREPYSSAILDFIHHQLKGSIYFDPYILIKEMKNPAQAEAGTSSLPSEP